MSSLPPRFWAIDGHADTPQRFLDEAWHFDDPLGSGMLNLTSAREGGLGAEVLALWVDPAEYPGKFAQRTLALLEATLQQIERLTGKVMLCRSAVDLDEARRTGQFGIVLGIEGGHSIEAEIGLLRTFWRLGVRLLTLTWSHSVGWADSSGDATDPAVPHAHGLSAFGGEVIDEMNRLGMLIDVSHASDETFQAVLARSASPVLASHSCARAVTAAHRNLTDDQLRALRNNGGVAMVNLFPAFLDDRWRLEWNAQQAERQRAHAQAAAPFRRRGEPVPFAVSNRVDRSFAERLQPAPFSAVLDHLDHMIAVAGPGHVGLGTDFDGIPALPSSIRSAADLPRIAEGMLQRGHTEAVVQAVFSENVLRVFRAATARSEEIRQAGPVCAPSPLYSSKI